MQVNIVWLRRDLRLEDNKAIERAMAVGLPMQLVFIFDEHILGKLPKDDARVSFIHDQLSRINGQLTEVGSSIKIYQGKVEEAWRQILSEFNVNEVFTNKDFEPYGRKRDFAIHQILEKENITLNRCLDHIIFEPTEILKNDGNPYTVYTPYKNKWLSHFENYTYSEVVDWKSLHWNQSNFTIPSLKEIGFEKSTITVEDYDLSQIADYANGRDFPAKGVTSKLGPHLRFGAVSIRQLLLLAQQDAVFLSELIWREFFIQILYHFPHVTKGAFRSKYDAIKWENDLKLFELWKEGRTGYPLVDAGMRELKASGYMHNRVRMVVASFLIKHLLIDWKWGEAYFAEKLLDFELASNNGNWQWVAGTGCDAAPYFRVFNPTTQQQKFDKSMVYIQKWVPEVFDSTYSRPIVEHKSARLRAIETYKNILG